MTLHLLDVYRITTYVPSTSVDDVVAAMVETSPYTHGNYAKTAWWSALGTEQFEPLPGSNPTAGETHVLERLPSVQVEIAIPLNDGVLERVLAALRDAHPWEEPAIFISAAKTSLAAHLAQGTDSRGSDGA